MVVFYPELLHIVLVPDAHVMQYHYTVNYIFQVIMVPHPYWSLTNCILGLEDTKCPFHIFPICMLFGGE
jgi:hypothetical protein